MELVAVVAVTLWAQSDPVPVLSAVVGTIAVALGSFVGWRSYQARKKVDVITLGLTTLTASLARSDVDRVLQETRCAQDLARMQAQIDEMEERHQAENDRCDAKLRRLGQIVKDHGGKVPDDLVGLHAA